VGVLDGILYGFGPPVESTIAPEEGGAR
jgi:hypothetical protein